MQVQVECGWEVAGQVSRVAAGLQIPPLPDAPGVYQWVFAHEGRERRYVGEAANLRERFESYRRPRAADGTNSRMRDRALRVLEAGGEVELLVAVEVRIGREGVGRSADLSSKHVRCLVENAALIDLLASAGELVNDKGYGTLRDDPVLG